MRRWLCLLRQIDRNFWTCWWRGVGHGSCPLLLRLRLLLGVRRLLRLRLLRLRLGPLLWLKLLQLLRRRLLWRQRRLLVLF